MQLSLTKAVEYRKELEEARRNNQFRGAFGSIIRRNYTILVNTDIDFRRAFLRSIGVATSYTNEMGKTVNAITYDIKRNK